MGLAPTRPYGKKSLPSGLTGPWVRQRPAPPIPRGVMRDFHPRIRSDKKGAKLARGFVICVWFKITILTASWTEVRITNRVILIAQSDPHPPVIWGNFLRFGLRDFKTPAVCDLWFGARHNPNKNHAKGTQQIAILKDQTMCQKALPGEPCRFGQAPSPWFSLYFASISLASSHLLFSFSHKRSSNQPSLEYSRKRAHCRMIHWFWPKHCGTQHNPIYREIRKLFSMALPGRAYARN